jgi:hypothetical protein
MQQVAAYSPPLELRASAPVEPTVAPRWRISARLLLGIYAIVPLCLFAMAFDLAFWDGALFRTLPTSPESYFFFQLAFGTPHIIASSIILFSNPDYVRTYWLRLFGFTLLLGVFFGGGMLIFEPTMFYHLCLALIGAATVMHVIKQQVGVGKGICRLSSWMYDAWGWSSIAFGSILYYAIYSYGSFSPGATFWLRVALWTLGIVISLLAAMCHWRIKTGIGKLYLWANTLMVLQSGLFYAEGYAFLAILGPRLVHDTTAFIFYISHDVNRHGGATHNPLYWLASKLGFGVFWVCPVLAVLLTYLMGEYIDPLARDLGYRMEYGASFIIIGYLGLLHYYTESFTWKQGSPYRQHFAMTA